MKIAFIGAGTMAEALIARLPRGVIVSDIRRERLNHLKKKYKARIAKSNLAAFQEGDVIILAVKPQQMSEVLNEISRFPLPVSRNKLIISIAAGIPLNYLQKRMPGYPIIRGMPNNPCLIGEGATAMAKGRLVGKAQYRKAEQIFNSVGEVISVPEKWMDAVTGLSGSGPAYIYQVIQALVEGGAAAGLPRKLALKLALQTVTGSAGTVKQTGKLPQALCEMVASPGGTTREGLKALEKFRFRQALVEAVKAAAKKSRILSQRWTL
jgi:pyrroline-5-carboxylate reductase